MNINGNIFPKRLTVRKVTEVYTAAAKATGIKYPSIHSLRHVSLLKSSGMRHLTRDLLMNKYNRLKKFTRELFIDKVKTITGLHDAIISGSLKGTSEFDYPDIFDEITLVAATPLKRLPVIIPDIKSELAMAFFEKRMKG